MKFYRFVFLATALTIVLLMAGCNSNTSEISKKQFQTVKDELYVCQSQLDMYRNSNSASSPQESTSQEEAKSEPSCEDKNFDEIYQDGKLLATCDSEEVKLHECGVNAGNCENGYAYVCLKDIKFKTITKQVCNKE